MVKASQKERLTTNRCNITLTQETCFEHSQLNSNGLVSIDWSPDGNSVAVSGIDIGSVVMNSETGTQTLRLVTGETYDSQWNPSGYLITSSLSGLRLWDGDTELVRILGVVDSQVSDNIPFEVAVSVNSDSIAVLGTCSIYDPVLETSNLSTVLQVYNVDTLDLINSIYLSSDIVPSKLEWSHSGTYLAIGSQDGYIRVWEVTTLALIDELFISTGIYAFDWLSDNEIVFVDDDSELSIIQIQNGSSPTPSPTVTPTPTATSAPFQRLRLTSLCSENPAQYRVWRVRNFNAYDVVFTWDVYNSPGGQNGFGVAPPASGSTPGEITFITQTEPGANTVRLFVEGAQQDVKASSSAQC